MERRGIVGNSDERDEALSPPLGTSTGWQWTGPMDT